MNLDNQLMDSQLSQLECHTVTMGDKAHRTAEFGLTGRKYAFPGRQGSSWYLWLCIPLASLAQCHVFLEQLNFEL